MVTLQEFSQAYVPESTPSGKFGFFSSLFQSTSNNIESLYQAQQEAYQKSIASHSSTYARVVSVKKLGRMPTKSLRKVDSTTLKHLFPLENKGLFRLLSPRAAAVVINKLSIEHLNLLSDRHLQSAEVKRACKNKFAEISRDEECAVCLEKLTKSQFLRLQCTHLFHTACLSRNMLENKTTGHLCSACKTPLAKRDIELIRDNGSKRVLTLEESLKKYLTVLFQNSAGFSTMQSIPEQINDLMVFSNSPMSPEHHKALIAVAVLHLFMSFHC